LKEVPNPKDPWSLSEQGPWDLPGGRASKRKALSSLKRKGTRQDPIDDLSEYSYWSGVSVSRGLNLAKFKNPSEPTSDIQKRIDEITQGLTKFGEIDEEDDDKKSVKSSTLEPMRERFEANQKYLNFILPENPSQPGKVICDWLGGMARSVIDPDFTIQDFDALPILKDFKDAEIDRAIQRIAARSYAIDKDGRRHTKDWPKSMLEAHSTVMTMFRSLRLNGTAQYPEWIRAIQLHLSPVFSIIRRRRDIMITMGTITMETSISPPMTSTNPSI
jgi:hypothetical protein